MCTTERPPGDAGTKAIERVVAALQPNSDGGPNCFVPWATCGTVGLQHGCASDARRTSPGAPSAINTSEGHAREPGSQGAPEPGGHTNVQNATTARAHHLRRGEASLVTQAEPTPLPAMKKRRQMPKTHRAQPADLALAAVLQPSGPRSGVGEKRAITSARRGRLRARCRTGGTYRRTGLCAPGFFLFAKGEKQPHEAPAEAAKTRSWLASQSTDRTS